MSNMKCNKCGAKTRKENGVCLNCEIINTALKTMIEGVQSYAKFNLNRTVEVSLTFKTKKNEKNRP